MALIFKTKNMDQEMPESNEEDRVYTPNIEDITDLEEEYPHIFTRVNTEESYILLENKPLESDVQDSRYIATEAGVVKITKKSVWDINPNDKRIFRIVKDYAEKQQDLSAGHLNLRNESVTEYGKEMFTLSFIPYEKVPIAEFLKILEEIHKHGSRSSDTVE